LPWISISLKFGTKFDYVTPDVLQMFTSRPGGQRSRS